MHELGKKIKSEKSEEKDKKEDMEVNGKVTVFLGVSGGVDSGVSAALLKLQGFNVVGVYMKCWDEKDEFGVCKGEKDMQDAQQTCAMLNIPFKQVDFVKEYWHEIFTYFLDGYTSGLTPNPDVLCNKKIKFHHFVNYCVNNGADLVATGHYARAAHKIERGADGKLAYETHLLRGSDGSKDQSYFLSAVNSNQLSRVIFPVGNLTKVEVRRIAASIGLKVAQKKNSVGLCFVGKRSLPEFLSQYIDGKNGRYLTLDNKILGPATGVNFKTVGQRTRISGQSDRYFVCGIDFKKNDVVVCAGSMNPALFIDTCTVKDAAWVNGPPQPILEGKALRCHYQARYQQEIGYCSVKQVANNEFLVEFDVPHKAAAAGQIFVMYTGDLCLGSAIIHKMGETYHDMGKELPNGMGQMVEIDANE